MKKRKNKKGCNLHDDPSHSDRIYMLYSALYPEILKLGKTNLSFSENLKSYNNNSRNPGGHKYLKKMNAPCVAQDIETHLKKFCKYAKVQKRNEWYYKRFNGIDIEKELIINMDSTGNLLRLNREIPIDDFDDDEPYQAYLFID